MDGGNIFKSCRVDDIVLDVCVDEYYKYLCTRIGTDLKDRALS